VSTNVKENLIKRSLFYHFKTLLGLYKQKNSQK